MAVRLTAEEHGADVVIRREMSKDHYRIYPISDAALRWLKARSPHAQWGRLSGQEAMEASRDDLPGLVADIRSNDFQVRGQLPVPVA